MLYMPTIFLVMHYFFAAMFLVIENNGILWCLI